MAIYSLTDRQKEMLRSIAPGLKDGSVKTEWVYLTGSGRIISILGLSNAKLQTEIWNNVTEADFDDFSEVGLFRLKGEYRYTLNAQRIIDAVKSNFGEDDEPLKDHTKSAKHLIFDPIFGSPSPAGQYKADIFMLMPFHESFSPIYYDHVKPAVESLNLTINRGDDFFSKHSIMTDVWSAIYYAQLVIADCTGKNGNVFYELGIAHTIGKPVIMITQDKAGVPFDVADKRYIHYDLAEMKAFEQQVKDAIRKVLSDLDGK